VSADLGVSRETADRIDGYVALLEKWTRRINLIASGDLANIRERHIRDGLQVAAALCPSDRALTDLGTGAGLPGIVVAIARPDLHVTLIEADARKASFLRAARRELGLEVNIIGQRIETASPVGSDVVTARALAPLPKLLGLVARHVSPTGRAVLLKGGAWKREVASARNEWDFEHVASASATDPDGVVLTIRNIGKNLGRRSDAS
jgi:16S rRNA (guanine527-N7)-methyltransferase